MSIAFKVGDIVSRDGTDLQRILEINDAGDLMHVECIREPLGWLKDDGSRDEPWCRLGETEWNLPRRYHYPDDLTIDHTPTAKLA